MNTHVVLSVDLRYFHPDPTRSVRIRVDSMTIEENNEDSPVDKRATSSARSQTRRPGQSLANGHEKRSAERVSSSTPVGDTTNAD